MFNSAADLGRDIDEALERITDLFLQQCTHGAQTTSLGPTFAACGQFIGDDASTNLQGGLHGIAAALRVLAPCKSLGSRDLVRRLVAYCEVCFGLDSSVAVKRMKAGSLENVIKLGELLYSLAFVSTAHTDTNRLIRHIAGLLQHAMVRDRGWGYFLGDAEPQLLPTAYAIRGLAQNGVDISTPRRFVVDSLKSRSRSSSSSAADVTTAVACAYCLTFSASSKEDRTISDTYSSAWRVLEPTLGEDIEQNLEYSHDGSNHYVRVPMQLYLLALASEYDWFRFASFRAQRRLKAVIDALRTASFKYPYSGRFLSARTNGVAFDALTIIQDRLKRLTALWIAYRIDRLRMILGSRWVRVPAAVLSLGIIGYSVYQWVRVGTATDLAPNLVASFLVLLLVLARR